MRLLLDTHVLMWALDKPERLTTTVLTKLRDADNEVLFSAASIWEIAIKARLRRDNFIAQPEQIAQAARKTGFTELPVHGRAAELVADLPLHHRDPFDRLLVAQAMAEPARFYTADAVLAQYSDLVTVIQ